MTQNYSGCFKNLYCFLRNWYLYFLATRNSVYILLKRLRYLHSSLENFIGFII